MTDLSIVIVSWNTRPLVLECLASIRAELRRCRERLAVETVVVDNGSRDGTAAAVAACFPWVRILGLPANVGYAAGCNAGLRDIRGRHVLLLNSDARVVPGALEDCVRFLDENPGVGIVGPQLLNPDGSKQNSIHNYPRLTTELVPKSVLQFVLRRRFPSRRWTGVEPFDVEAVTGAALFARASVVRAVGRLAEDYFFFFEETDLCQRVRRAGWRVVHLPGARVVHESGASSKRKEPALTRIEYHRSLYRYYRKFHGRTWMVLAVALRFSKSAFYVLSQLPLTLDGRRRARWREHRDVMLWHLHGCPPGRGLRTLAGDEGFA